MTDVYIIKAEDVLETRFNDDNVMIKVKNLMKLDFIPSIPKPHIEFQAYWEDFILDFFDQKSIKDLSSNDKKELAEFLKKSIKYKLLKRIY